MNTREPDYHPYPASPQISDFVRRYMYVEADHHIETPLYPAPTGCGYMGYLFGGEAWCFVDGVKFSSRTGLHFCCQIDRREFVVHYQGKIGHIMAEFTATGMYRLFGQSTGSLHQLWHDAINVIDPEIAETIKRDLSSAPSRNARIAAFDQAFIHLAKSARPEVPIIDEAARLIEQSQGRISISELCKMLDVSDRNLSRKFSQFVGVTPKFYARAVQLNNIMQRLLSRGDGNLTDLAIESGFYDQSHFIKSVQKFIAKTPKEITGGERHMINWFVGELETLGEATPTKKLPGTPLPKKVSQ